MFHLNNHSNETINEKKTYSSTKDIRFLIFHLLQLFQHFDITNSKYFIKNKANFVDLMRNLYSSVILKDTNEIRKIKNMFNYVCYLVYLNITDLVAFKYFISNQSVIEMKVVFCFILYSTAFFISL